MESSAELYVKFLEIQDEIKKEENRQKEYEALLSEAECT